VEGPIADRDVPACVLKSFASGPLRFPFFSPTADCNLPAYALVPFPSGDNSARRRPGDGQTQTSPAL